MAPKRSKNSALGLIRYNKVVAETRKALKKSGHDISYNEARKYVSNYVYPSLKGIPTYKLHKTVINRKASTLIRHIPPESVQEVPYEDDVRNIGWGSFFENNFWQLQNILETRFPGQLTVFVNAGPLGQTERFKVSDLYKHLEKIQEIIENVRLLSPTVKSSSGDSGAFHWDFILSLLPGHPDNHDAKNYICEIGLVNSKTLEDIHAESKDILEHQVPIAPAPKNLRKGTEERAKLDKYKKLLKQKSKEFFEKQKHVQLAKKPTAKQLIKLNEQKLKELELLRQDYKDGIFTKAQYKKEREAINKKYPA